MRIHEPERHVSRRTALKTAGLTGAALLGAPTVAGRTQARPGRGDSAKGIIPGQASVLEVVGKHDHDADEHRFELSTQTVPSGWTTIEFDNQTSHAHFLYLAKVPDVAVAAAAAAGVSLRNYYHDKITKPVQGLMDLLVGRDPRHEIVFPDWFPLAGGGVGLTAGNSTASTTVDLAPGEYIIECYVKNGDNVFHSYLGMLAHLSVTEASTDAPEPDATLDVPVSSAGLDVPTEVRPGQHTIAVQFLDQQIYPTFAGHDLNLIRLTGDTTVADVNDWMDVLQPDGLVSDGTEPETFLGGANEIVTPALLAGEDTVTEYFHVTLTPGEYAWVSEVPDPAEKNLLAEFSVPAAKANGPA